MFSFLPVQLALIKETHWVGSCCLIHTYTHTHTCIYLGETLTSATERENNTWADGQTFSESVALVSKRNIIMTSHSKSSLLLIQLNNEGFHIFIPTKIIVLLKHRSKTTSIFVRHRASRTATRCFLWLCALLLLGVASYSDFDFGEQRMTLFQT